MDFQEMKGNIKQRLEPDRFKHVMGVVDTASRLAQYLNIDVSKLKLAALLHDCAKYMDHGELLEYAVRHDIPITTEDKRVPAILHARVGAYMASQEFGVEDPEVLDAIRVHPTGTAGIGIYARALFVCDYIEPGRRLKKTDKMTRLAFSSFEEAVLAIIIEKNKWVLKKKRPLHQEGIDFYHDQLKRVGI